MAWRIMLFAAVLAFGAMPAHAAETKANEGQLGGLHGTTSLEAGPQIYFDVSYKLWTLLGEPVTDMAFRWTYAAARQVPNPDPQAYRLKTALQTQVPVDMLDKKTSESITPYNVTIAIRGIERGGGAQSYYLILDAGVPGGENQESFHVPGSPEWGELFFHDRLGEKPVDAQTAKRIMRNGFMADKVDATRLSWSYGWLETYLYENTAADAQNLLVRAAEDFIRSLEHIQELPVAGLQQKLAGIKARLDQSSDGAELRAFVSKLSEGPPAAYRIPARQEAFGAHQKEILEALEKEKKAQTAHIVFDPKYQGWLKAKKADMASRKPLPKSPWLGKWKMTGAEDDPLSFDTDVVSIGRGGFAKCPAKIKLGKAIDENVCEMTFFDDGRLQLAVKGTTKFEHSDQYGSSYDRTFSGKWHVTDDDRIEGKVFYDWGGGDWGKTLPEASFSGALVGEGINMYWSIYYGAVGQDPFLLTRLP